MQEDGKEILDPGAVVHGVGLDDHVVGQAVPVSSRFGTFSSTSSALRSATAKSLDSAMILSQLPKRTMDVGRNLYNFSSGKNSS